jgi:hypothetical protein
MTPNNSIPEIQERCRSAAERLEALAGSPHDLIASTDPNQGLFLEASSLLRGHHQPLLVESILTRLVTDVGCLKAPERV